MRLTVVVLLSGALLQSVASVADDAVFSDEQRRIVCYLKATMGCAARWAWRDTREADAEIKDTLTDLSEKSCAVVSSSGALVNHSLGEEIDSHDVVIRFNKAPTAGYEEFVGSKTTLRFGWDFDGVPPTDALAKGFDGLSLAGEGVMSYLYPTDIGQVRESGDVTSGFGGMLMAFLGCGVVDSYEMAPSKYAAKAPYHYFGKIRYWVASNNAWHSDYKAEHDLWARLSTLSRDELSETGKTHTPGFSKVHCPANIHLPASLEANPPTPKPCAQSSYRFSFSLINLPDALPDSEIPCTVNLFKISLSALMNMSATSRCVDVRVGTSPSASSRRLGSNALLVAGTVATSASLEDVRGILSCRAYGKTLCLYLGSGSKTCNTTAVLVEVESQATAVSTTMAGTTYTTTPAATKLTTAPAATSMAGPATTTASTSALPRVLACTTLRTSVEKDHHKQASSTWPWWAICCIPVLLIALGCYFFMPASAVGRRTKVNPAGYEIVQETAAD